MLDFILSPIVRIINHVAASILSNVGITLFFIIVLLYCIIVIVLRMMKEMIYVKVCYDTIEARFKWNEGRIDNLEQQLETKKQIKVNPDIVEVSK